MSEQEQFLESHVVHFGIGTPSRILKLLQNGEWAFHLTDGISGYLPISSTCITEKNYKTGKLQHLVIRKPIHVIWVNIFHLK